MSNEYLDDDSSNYSKALRAIGHALEALSADLVDLRCEGGNYIVHAKARKQPSKASLIENLRKGGFRVLWQTIPSRFLLKKSLVALDLFYTPKDVERLEYEGQARRENGGTPDPHSPTAALRAIGAHINSKEACLLGISRRDGVMTVQYETSRGDRCREEFTPASLYELFVAMYLKRSDRKSKERA
jgi:hypothetical protein